MKQKKNLRIILEGPDGCGKTTIAYYLSKELNIPIFKNQRTRNTLYNNEDDSNQFLSLLKWGVSEQLELIKQCDVSLIFDRLFPSEYVYSRVYMRNLYDDLVHQYDLTWHKMNGIIIFLDRKQLTKRDELVHSNEYNDIRMYYQEYREKTYCKNLFIDTSDEKYKNHVKIIKDFINR